MASVEIHNVSEQGGYVKKLLSELRDKNNIDPGIFGATLKTLGFIMGVEISKTLPYDETQIETPLAITTGYKLAQPPVIGTILRAGLPLFDGVRQVFPQTNTIIVDSSRIENPDGSIGVVTRSVKGTRVGGKVLILADTMLATGGSLLAAIEAVEQKAGKPSEVHIVSAIAASEGVERVRQGLEGNGYARASIWCAAIDSVLNDQSYIVPGLGDAGDRIYGLNEL